MIRVKLPFGGINPDQLGRASPTSSSAMSRCARGTSRRVRTLQLHHVPLPDAAKTDPRDLAHRPVRRGRARQHDPQRHRRPVGWGLPRNELFDPTPYVGAYVRYFVRNEVCQLMPRKFKTAFSRNRTRTSRSPGSTTAASSRGSGTAAAGSSCGSAAAPRSCRASRRRCTSSSAPTTASTEGDGGGAADLQPPGRAARQSGAGADQVLVDPHRDRRVPRSWSRKS